MKNLKNNLKKMSLQKNTVKNLCKSTVLGGITLTLTLDQDCDLKPKPKPVSNDGGGKCVPV